MKIFFLILFAVQLSSADITGINTENGKRAKIETFMIGNTEYASSNSLAEFLGGKSSIEFLNKRGKIVCPEFTIEFGLFSTFVRSGENVYNIYKPAEFRDGDFILPLRYIVDVIDQLSSLAFSLGSDELIASAPIFNVTGFSISQKLNGLLIEIFLKEPLKYNIMKSDDNWMAVSISDARIDSQKFVQEIPLKMIYDVRTYQFEKSGQVSVKFWPREFSFTSKLKENPYRIQILIRGEGFSDSLILVSTDMEDQIQSNPIDIIVIDPGHGGEDNGAIGRSGLKEKDVTLKLAFYLNELLKEDRRFKPVMTRQEDIFIPLSERTKLANAVGADVFISIHANSAKNKKATGTATYFLADAKTDEARAAASLENSSIRFERTEDQGLYATDLDFTLRDMMQSEFQKESVDLADMIQRRIELSAGINSRGVDQAGFHVLDRAYMPSVLVETAFISNAADEKRLKANAFLRKVARAIYDSIVEFKEKYETPRRSSE